MFRLKKRVGGRQRVGKDISPADSVHTGKSTGTALCTHIHAHAYSCGFTNPCHSLRKALSLICSFLSPGIQLDIADEGCFT